MSLITLQSKSESLLYSICILLFLIAVSYRQDVTSRLIPGKPLWYSYRRILALLAITMIPVLVINFWIPQRQLETPQERIEFGLKHKQPFMVSHAYRDLCREYPDSIELQFRYIDLLVDVHNYYYRDFTFDRRLHRRETLLLMKAYAQIVAKDGVLDEPAETQLPDDYPYVHYLKAYRGYTMGTIDEKAIEYHLLREIRLHHGPARVYKLLWREYLFTDNAKLDAFMRNPESAQYAPPGYRNSHYFLHGEFGLYAKNILSSRLGHVSWLTLVAAFLVSLVWVVFLRSMDVFSREKWSNIILVFLGGAVFTFLCLPIYDFAQLKLGFQLNGKAVNDFFYCFIVVGGSEEWVKLLPWLLFAVFSKRIREPYDFLLYASISALGFAFTENLMYLEDTGNLVTRTITSSVAHMFDASIVAYAFILAKYRYQKRVWKILTPVIGFVLAALAHGFYDFWLVSDAVQEYYFMTVIFFIASLHIWFFFKNNALNNSGFFSESRAYNANFQQDLLTFSLLGILMLEFIFVSWEYGADDGNQVIGSRSIIVFLFLIYMSLMLQRLDLKRGVWNKWRFRMPRFSDSIFGLPGAGSDDDDDDSDGNNFVGLRLRLFAPKTNPYIGDKLPKSGMCVRKITVGGNPNWYVFQLNTPIHYSNYASSHIIIKPKLAYQSLDEPKIEIYFMFIPDIFMIDAADIDIRRLRYAGRAYSMPV